MIVMHKLVLTPEQLHRVLGLPEGVEVREVSLTQRPPGVHVKYTGDLPSGWVLPGGAGECEPWEPADLIVRAAGSIFMPPPPTCTHGDHDWAPPESELWIAGDGVWHRWRDGVGWVHDESIPAGSVLDLATMEPAVSEPG